MLLWGRRLVRWVGDGQAVLAGRCAATHRAASLPHISQPGHIATVIFPLIAVISPPQCSHVWRRPHFGTLGCRRLDTGASKALALPRRAFVLQAGHAIACEAPGAAA